MKGVAALAGLVLAAPAAAQEAPVRAPFFTTPPEVVARMLALADTRAGDFVIDLGSGDGRIVIHAARAHGARGLGVDLDAALVARSRDHAARVGVADRVRFEVRDALRTDLSAASVVTIYLLPFLLDRLEPRLLHGLRPGARVVSHAFAFPSWRYDQSETVRLERAHPTQGESSRIFLYVVPAQARGAWRATGGWRLRVQQNFQDIEVETLHQGRPRAVRSARLRGEDIAFSGDGFSFRGRVTRETIAGEMLEGGVRAALAFERAP
ncbi:MAG: SAM-dependent methyltransferase [Burkholderiales bacterium]